MQRTSSSGKKPTQFAALALLAAVAIGAAGLRAAEPSEPPFEGQKSTWHGFDRYDFVMDCTDLTLKPCDSGVGGVLLRCDHHGMPRVYRLRRPSGHSESQPRHPHQFSHRHLILL